MSVADVICTAARKRSRRRLEWNLLQNIFLL